MVVKDLQNVPDSSRVEVGEIDTSAPFASVKAAVSMFGETSASPEKSVATVRKPKPQASESPLAKERQLLLAQRELNKLKEKLKTCNKKRIQASDELEKDKKTIDELEQKLKAVDESKEAARKVTEHAKAQIKDLGGLNSPCQFERKQELESAREQYATAIKELDLVKQELRSVKKDIGSSRDAKNSAIQQEAEAKQLVDINMQKAEQLSEEVASIQESIMLVKIASSQSHLEESGALSDKDAEQLSCKFALEESEQKLAFLRQQYEPELASDHESQLEKINSEIEYVRKELERARAPDFASLANVLEDARSTLRAVMEEESSIRCLVETAKLEIENTKKTQLEMRRTEQETITLISNLQSKVKESKVKLNTASEEESKVRESYDDLISTLKHLSVETENTWKDTELMKKNTEEMMEEKKLAFVALEEKDRQLKVALAEAEMVKAGETDALNQIKILSERANLARNSTSDSGAKITIPAEEFQSLSRKVEESETMAGTKVAAALSQLEMLKAREEEINKKLEAMSKEMAEIDMEIEMSAKRAENSEAAMRALESEMKKLREAEQKRAAEATATPLAEMEEHVHASPPKVRIPRSNLSHRFSGIKIIRETSHATKKALVPNLVGMFHKKKNKPNVESPSYVSSEKPGLLGVLD